MKLTGLVGSHRVKMVVEDEGGGTTSLLPRRWRLAMWVAKTLAPSVCNVRTPHPDLLSDLLHDQISHQPDRNSALTLQWPSEDNALFANTVNGARLTRWIVRLGYLRLL